MNKTELFRDHEKLIYKQSHYHARQWGMDFEEVKSQGFLIFYETIERFKKEKNTQFSTYLYWRLLTLGDYCRKEKGLIDQYTIPSGGKLLEESIDTHLDRILFYQMVDLLSTDGEKIVKSLVEGIFHKPNMDRQRPVGKSRIKEIATKEWGWTQSRVDKVWGEVGEWWNNTVN